MHRNYLAAGAILGAAGVALGAFGAHGLQKMTTDENVIRGFQTAVHYQLIHALALLGVSIVYGQVTNRMVKWAGSAFLFGVILFSGSLYLLTFLKLQGSAATRFIGPVTPLGGIVLISGWIFLLLGVMRKK